MSHTTPGVDLPVLADAITSAARVFGVAVEDHRVNRYIDDAIIELAEIERLCRVVAPELERIKVRQMQDSAFGGDVDAGVGS